MPPAESLDYKFLTAESIPTLEGFYAVISNVWNGRGQATENPGRFVDEQLPGKSTVLLQCRGLCVP
jgi:hypothetical protein